VPVDLQVVDRVIAEQLHLAMADAEIVDGQLEARLAHLRHEIGKFRYTGIVEPLGELETNRGRGDLSLAQVLHQLFKEIFPVRDQPDVEVEEKGRGGKAREGRKFCQRPRRHHLFERQKLAGLMRLVEQFDGRGKADPFLATHQGFISEDRTGADFDNRLQGIFQDELGKRDQLVVCVTS
jgi:hypothetical protein